MLIKEGAFIALAIKPPGCVNGVFFSYRKPRYAIPILGWNGNSYLRTSEC